MRILVTGGAGFIGSNFIRYMLREHRGYNIINLDALTYCGNLDNLKEVENHKNYVFVRGDICDPNIVDDLTRQVDWVVNFAAESHVDNSIKNPDIFVITNVMGTHNLLHFALKNKVKKFLQVSTDEVYGSLGEVGYFYEDSPLAPNSPYSASKASADLMVRAYHETYGLPTLITRCSNNFGPNQHHEKLIPHFISKLVRGEKVPVYGDGKNIRDWLYVYDHCRAIHTVLLDGKPGEIYNVGGDNERTNLEITKLILKELGKDESSIEFVEDRLGHDRRYAICHNKISKELGWVPWISFEDGIRMTIRWYLENDKWLRKF